MSKTEDLKQSTIASATWDTILQVGLRLVSFFLNAFIVRHVTREVFAVMTVRLHLLYSTGLLLSREAFRRAALSSKGTTEIHKLVNLVWLGTLASIPLGLCGCYVWLFVMESPPKNVTQDYKVGVIFIASSVIIEVIAEVPFVLAELQLWVKTKVVIEGMMQLLRSILLAVFIYTWSDHAVLMYGVAHISGSILYVIAYYTLFAVVLNKKQITTTKLPINHFYQLFPTFGYNKTLPEIDKNLGSVAWSFFKQGWLKEALTEGEWYLMNFLPLVSLAQQGVYQVVNNLGSLAARLVFRSIESAAYKYFAQMMERGKSVTQQDQDKVCEVVKFFSHLLNNLLIISLIIVTFGWSYSRTLLQFYGGTQLSDGEGTTLMRFQCLFVVFLAINGITEAYTFAVMNDRELSQHSRMMVLFSFIYVAMVLILTQILGAVGFILANCTNMTLRIIHSCWFIQKQYADTDYHPLEGLSVPLPVLGVFATVSAITIMSEAMFSSRILLHITIGGVCLLAVAYAVRWELQSVIEKILTILENLNPYKNKSKTNVEFTNTWIIDRIHWFLYRRHKYNNVL